MKKMLSIAVAAIAIASNAAGNFEKIGGIQVVDTAGLTSTVMKLGEISGNTMVAAMAAAKIAEIPSSAFFGPTRQGCSIYLPLYIDTEDLANADDFSEFASDIQFALVYPMALPKEEFLKLHPGAVETNGMVRVKGELLTAKEDWDDDSVVYVAFSEDGKWAVASEEEPVRVALALADVALAEKPMEGDVFRCNFTPRGVSAMRKFITDDEAKRLADGVDSFAAALRVSDAGVDTHGSVRLVTDSDLAKFGVATLPEDPFEFDKGESVSALANSFVDESGFAKSFDELLSILAKNGVDIRKFVTCVETGDSCRVSCDFGAAIKHFSDPANSLIDVDTDKIMEDIEAWDAGSSAKPATKAQGISLAIAGYKPKFSATQRFAAVLPEVKGKKLCYANTYSPCAFVQAIVASVLPTLDIATRSEIAPVVALLPQESVGGLAAAYWRDGDELGFIGRLSADELRNVVTGATAIFAYTMMMRAKQIDAEAGEDCADDDDDDDDDEDSDDEDDTEDDED